MINLPVFDEAERERAMRDTLWIDGLRGIASIFVVCSHLVLCYARALFRPCCAEGSETPYLFQRPIIRLVGAGHAWVAVFLILSGFVNALKPIKLARTGQINLSLSKIAQFSLNRIFRLVLPATAATLLNWLMCQLGLYEVARHSDAYWLLNTTPAKSPGLLIAVKDLSGALKATWMMNEDNIYDQPQWVLIYLLQGSMMITCALLVTISMTSFWRTVTMAILSMWSVNWTIIVRDPFIGLCFFAGIILAELCLSGIPEKIGERLSLATIPLLIGALIFMSYPPLEAERTTWSRILSRFGKAYLPVVSPHEDFERIYGSIGGILLIFSIAMSPHARILLSSEPLLWLGRISFAIYLLQGILLRTIFAWTLSAGHARTVPKEGYSQVYLYPVPGLLQCGLATVVFFACLLLTSYLWNLKAEPIFAAITTKAEGIVRGHMEDKKPGTGTEPILPIHKD